MELRGFKPEDTEGIIALIDGIYREYGDRVHLEQAEADLKDIPAHFEPGNFQVLDDVGTVRGTVAIAADGADVCYLKRLYLDSGLRGQDWADTLLEWAVDAARGLGAQRMALWSDVRFGRAHRFYHKHGFERDGRVRTMNDAWEPYSEYFYAKEL